MLNTATAAVLALSTVAPVHRVADPPLHVDLVSAVGSGCRGAFVGVAADNRSFEIGFGDFVALVDGHRPVDRKSCRLGLRIVLPAGYTYGIAGATYRGYVDLRPGAAASHRAKHHIQGGIGLGGVESRFAGPRVEEWQADYAPDLPMIVYAPCGERRDLIVDSELRAALGTSNPATPSGIAADTVADRPGHMVFRLATKACRVIEAS
ncbi:DUF4360 domain-containing protein [Saccharothrix violaceirubra]|uniref:Secreted protein n=1 Tax=Saccharothrix violaceirubra TaxID=413306 RepID=A0A7W7T2Q5_9PSEU|nr:DUF4360 domain-containing protein [Saccharothrix violaceirubra]MBB4965473.1 hypothetical protein [Saccharothrix violaceirubra]